LPKEKKVKDHLQLLKMKFVRVVVVARCKANFFDPIKYSPRPFRYNRAHSRSFTNKSDSKVLLLMIIAKLFVLLTLNNNKS